MKKPLYDFHMHSIFSDGALLPSEIVRRVVVRNHIAIAITDHADLSNIPTLLQKMKAIASEINSTYNNFQLLTGVELTHVPPTRIDATAKIARSLGAQIIVVHGETSIEPVASGTNQAAIDSEYVDILAHPGFLTDSQVIQGAERELFFELSARKGHCLGNGLVARLCEQHNGLMLVNSDAHNPNDFLIRSLTEKIVLGSGLSTKWIPIILERNPQQLLKRCTIE